MEVNIILTSFKVTNQVIQRNNKIIIQANKTKNNEKEHRSQTKEDNMTKTRNTMMNSEINETDMAKGTKKGKKSKADNSKQPELPSSITCHGYRQIFI